MNLYAQIKMVHVTALNTEVIGMQAENEDRRHRGEAPVYTEEAFNTMALRIRNIVLELEDIQKKEHENGK